MESNSYKHSFSHQALYHGALNSNPSSKNINKSITIQLIDAPCSIINHLMLNIIYAPTKKPPSALPHSNRDLRNSDITEPSISCLLRQSWLVLISHMGQGHLEMSARCLHVWWPCWLKRRKHLVILTVGLSEVNEPQGYEPPDTLSEQALRSYPLSHSNHTSRAMSSEWCLTAPMWHNILASNFL